MVERSKGLRSKLTRKIKPKYSGLSRFFKEYKIGQKVLIKIDASFHKGMPSAKFHGKIAQIIGKRGRSYILKVLDGSKEKILFVNPAHIEEIK